MNRIRHIRCLAAALAVLTGALLAFTAAAPTALAIPDPPLPPGWQLNYPLLPSWQIVGEYEVPGRVPVHTVVIGGMPGWQIALIAASAALLGATAAVLLDRARAARRKTISAAA